MKKHITRKEWEYIGKYNPAAKWLRPFCSYTLEEIEGGYRRQCKIPWLLYLLLFIPFHIVQALYCMWDGGLKEFEVECRHLDCDDIHEIWDNYPKAKEVWEKH
jgi:hypothetical protein